MILRFQKGPDGDPMRLVLGLIVTPLLGWWFLAVHSAGEIVVRAGPRGARGHLDVDRLTDPTQFNVGLGFIGLLFLVSLAGLLSTAWDIVVGSERGSDQP